MKITKRQLRRIIREEKARLTEMFDTNNIDMRATDFSLYDTHDDLNIRNDMRNTKGQTSHP